MARITVAEAAQRLKATYQWTLNALLRGELVGGKAAGKWWISSYSVARLRKERAAKSRSLAESLAK